MRLFSIRAWVGAILLLWWPHAVKAEPLCDNPAAVQHAIAEVSALEGTGRKSEAFRSLVSRVRECAAASRALYDVRHAAALFNLDNRLFESRLIDEDIRAAKAAGDHVNLIATAGRSLEQQIGMIEVDELAGYLDEAGTALTQSVPRLSRLRATDLSFAAPYSLNLCDTAVALITDRANSDRDLALGALRCTLRLNRLDKFHEVLPRLIELSVRGSDQEATSCLEQLLAYASATGDRAIVDQVAVKTRETAMRVADIQLVERLRLALASAFREAGASNEAKAEAAACAKVSPASDTCKLAAAILNPLDDEASRLVAQAIRSDDWSDSPSLAFPALRNVQALIVDNSTAADDISGNFGDIALPTMLRHCISIANDSMKGGFISAAKRAGAILRAEDGRIFANCLNRAIERDDGLDFPELAVLLPLTLSSVAASDAAKLQLTAAQALLAGTDGSEVRAARLAKDLLSPLAVWDGPAELAESRIAALKLLLRIAYDQNDSAESAKLRSRIIEAGSTVPAALAKDDRPVWERTRSRISASHEAFDNWRFNRFSANLDSMLFVSEADRLARLRSDLLDTVRAPALARQTKAATAGFRADRSLADIVTMSPACIALNLDTADGQDGLISDADNARINQLTPSISEMSTLIGRMPSWMTAGTAVPPFEIIRPHRSGDQAVADLSYEIEIFWRLARPTMVLRAHRLLREIRASYLAAVRHSCVMARLENPKEAYMAALLNAARLAGLSESEKLDLVGEAVDQPLSIRQVFDISREQRKDARAEEEFEQRHLRAIAARDVEGARALLNDINELVLRRTAAGQAEQPQPIETLGAKLQRAQAQLRRDEAILAWELTNAPDGAPLLITVLVGPRETQIAAKRIDEWRDESSNDIVGRGYEIDFVKIAEQLDAKLVARNGTTLDFDDRAARAIYGLTLGQLQLGALRRLYVIREPSEFPTSLMRAPDGENNTDWLLNRYDILYLQPDLKLPHDQITLSKSGKLMAFASPDYGDARSIGVSTIQPPERTRLFPEERRSYLTNSSPCGLQKLSALAFDGEDEQWQLFQGQSASETQLYLEDGTGGLKAAQLLLFYAHGEEIPIAGSRLTQFGIALTPTPTCPSGEIDELEEQEASPMTEQDGFLTSIEIATLDLGSPVVVLAGCNMARDGSFSASALPGAFFAAGSRIVVGSTREVLTTTTSALVSRLLASTSDASPAALAVLEAIRQSRQDPSGNGGNSMHPVYWSSWRVMVN